MRDAQAQTECIQTSFEFQDLESRKVVVDFSGGHLSSDGGTLLLREVDLRLGLCEQLAGCFDDRREERFVEHRLQTLIAQRVLGLALGYEDLNDHDALRVDPLLAAGCGCGDVLGESRRRDEDKGKPLAGKSTLNRLELGTVKPAPAPAADTGGTDTNTSATSSPGAGPYRKIRPDPAKIESLLVSLGSAQIPADTRVVVLDFDATDDPLHGEQEGRFYNGYYKSYCYLPLYCFCGDIPMWAELRGSDKDASTGTREALEKIVAELRAHLGDGVRIIVRGDSGFCRDPIMEWIEAQPRVHYCLGLARNPRLQRLLGPALAQAHDDLCHHEIGGCAMIAEAPAPARENGSARRFAELRYRTLDSWTRERRVVGKAEVLACGKENPRFIVTDISGEEEWAAGVPELRDGRALYEEFYCARGDMENRIKEQQLDLFSDRTSTGQMASNQLRLWFSTFAYMLVRGLRTEALAGTALAKATAGTIRTRLMKVAAHIEVSVRRIRVRLASACPMAGVFAAAHRKLCGPPEPPWKPAGAGAT